MRGDFTSAYKQLNGEQKQAVDSIDGPMLVIAGPGTGKTQLLALRVANILRLTDSLPENILCLTYTEAGSEEMQNRLNGLLGEDAYKVTVSTYHGFGSEIIRHNLSYFKGDLNLRAINELRIDSLIRDVQKDLPYTNSLKSHALVKDIRGLISDSKQALLTPKDIASVAAYNLEFVDFMAKRLENLEPSIARASKKTVDNFKDLITDRQPGKLLPKDVQPLSYYWNSDLNDAIELSHEAGNTKAISKWKLKYLARNDKNNLVVRGEDQLNRLQEFSDVYDAYNKLLEKKGLYDYDDMILMSIEALKTNPDLRYNLQERYLYFLLDEYQDTNLAQAELINLLISSPLNEGKPNVMAVGDDDQAIYAFQGAKHSNMLDFVKAFPGIKLVSLKQNYRSGKGIIDLSSSVAINIKDRLTKSLKGTNKQFEPASKKLSKLNLIAPASELEQFAYLTESIKKQSNKEIAVIAPKHSILETAARFLQSASIPISYERKENVLDDELVAQLITLARLILAIEKDSSSKLTDHLMSSVLNYDFWRLPTKVVWQTSWTAHDKHKAWLDVMLKQRPTKDIALLLLKLAASCVGSRFDTVIDQLIGLSEVSVLDKTLKELRSPFYEFYKSDEPKLIRLFTNLMSIRKAFKEFNSLESTPLMLSDFIDFIDELRLSDFKLSNDFNFSESGASVTLLTAHGAKGREFDHVYLLSVVNEVWGPKARNRSQRLSLPVNLEYIRQAAEDADDERRRLLYVALTRARDEVTLIIYPENDNKKPMAQLEYLAEADMPNPLQPKLKLNLKTVAEYWQSSDKTPRLSGDLKALLNQRLERYNLSASDLNTFIDVRHEGPRRFYERALLKYVSPSTPRTDFGSAIHDSLEWLQKSFTRSSKLPTLDQLLKYFESSLTKRRLLKHDHTNLLKEGKEALKIYYSANKSNFSKADLSEYNFKHEAVVIGKVRLTGKIDKLKVNKVTHEAEVIDYKAASGYETKQPTAGLHLYQNQLYFYKLLVENSVSFKGYKVNQGILDFIEPDNKGQLHPLTYDYKQAEVERFVQLIKAVWDHVNKLNFPDISKYSTDLKGIRAFEDDLINGHI